MKVSALPRKHIVVVVSGLLWLAHAAVVASLGSKALGPFLSDLIQLTLGIVLICSVVAASRRSEGMALSFWRLTAFAYGVWFGAQGFSVYNDVAASPVVSGIENFLFCFWFAPLAMAIFLDPDTESGELDALVALDFVQAVLVCVAAYLYFFCIPKSEWGEMAHSVWAPYFAGYGLVALSFILRGAISRTRDARILFGRMGMFLAVSGCVDALYYYGPGRGLSTGAWFDLLWSALLVTPILIATSWKQVEAPQHSFDPPRGGEKRIYTEIFFLLYPLLVLFMSLRIARERLGLAAVVVLLSFVCSSARLLVTQNRLLVAKDALRREASRDALTSLWNRKAILAILERDLLRAERDQAPVGLIMIDVDHFKAINDSRGHGAGDAVLRIIASGIASVVRPYDSVGRCGGEEFLIVAPGCDLAETWELAERVRSHVAGCNIIAGGASVQVSLSLGVAIGETSADIEKLLHAADTALYQAKNAGRNRVEPSMGRAAGAGLGASSPARDFWL